MNQPTRRPFDPHLLFGISLLAGLALAWPALRSAMHGGTDIIVAGVRLLISIGFAWTGGYLITTLFTSFAATANDRERADRDAADDEGPRRRVSDPVALPAGDPSAAIDS
jgi:hypothetical protein